MIHTGCVQSEIWFNRYRSIFYTVDPNAFASLALLNRKWRRISDSPTLYAHHLARCPSFSVARGHVSRSDGLESLKRRFFTEARRNTFDAFFRPRETLIKLISNSMSSSTAFPQGEAFRFSFSVSGQMILCISSSRIVVLDVSTESPVVRHELKTSRRPLDATILDDGSLVAVVSSSHQINIYTLSNEESKLIQCLVLNDTPRALALAPTGGVLAIAYDDRIEMQTLGEGVLTTDRRAVRCNGVDSIAFSSDGFMLLGSSTTSERRTVVSVTVPFFTGTEDDTSPSDAQVRMWTTQILFPDTIEGYTRACLFPLLGEDDWILGYDEQIGAFKAIRANNASSGATYFLGPLSENGLQELSPTMIPTADSKGELVALGFQDGGIWVYGVPCPFDDALSGGQTHGIVSDHAPTRPIDTQSIPRDNRLRLQQTLKKPNVLIDGHKMSDIPGITAARWVRYSHSTVDPVPKGLRLVAVAPGGVQPPTIGEEDVPVDGGRVLLLDFGRSTEDGEMIEMNIELGEAEPKILKEPNASMDTEVELERRRTRLHSGNTTAPRRLRSAGTRESYPAASSGTSQKLWPRHRRNSSYSSFSNNPGPNGPTPETPYNNNQPRSRDTLHRVATAAASTTRGRHYPRHINFQIPHESDADSWAPPPPPYTREPDAPLPEHLRRTLLPVSTEPVRRVEDASSRVRRSQSTRLESMVQDDPSRARPTLHRLNTITGSRLAARMRRLIREPESSGPYMGQRHTLQYIREGTLGHSPQSPEGPTETPISHLQQAPAIPGEALANTPQAMPQPNPVSTSPPVSPRTTDPTFVQPLSTPSNQTEHLVSQAMAYNLMESQSPMPNAEAPEAAMPTHYPFSFSSPNLRVRERRQEQEREPRHNPQPGTDAVPLTPTERRTWYQRVPNGRSRSQDLRQVTTPNPNPGIATLNRRVSTDPTLSTRTPSSAAANENWRRRIEEWNEQTIYETSKKNRNKCEIM